MTNETELFLVTATDLRSAAGLTHLLAAFEARPDTVPTSWGADERAREAYEREAMIARISSWIHNTGMPGLKRNKSLRYEGYFTASTGQLNQVTLEAVKVDDGPALVPFFALGDALARELAVEFGVVNMLTPEAPRFCKAASRATAREVQRNGPPAVGARTWLGPHLVAQIGRERLDALGLALNETSWGGVQFDLLPEPWAAGRAALLERQVAVTEILKTLGIFGDYSSLDRQPGPHWAPIPLPRPA